MVTTRKRQVRLLTMFMLIFATLFFGVLFSKDIDLIAKIIGGCIFAFAFGLLADHYIKVVNK